MKRLIVIGLAYLCYGLAWSFVGIAVVLAILPTVCILPFAYLYDELSDPWRRGSKQTRLWLWARRMKGEAP